MNKQNSKHSSTANKTHLIQHYERYVTLFDEICTFMHYKYSNRREYRLKFVKNNKKVLRFTSIVFLYITIIGNVVCQNVHTLH